MLLDMASISYYDALKESCGKINFLGIDILLKDLIS